MPTLRIYQKPEDAYLDAAFLCSMGIEAVVHQDPAYSGILLGVIEAPYRIETTEGDFQQAADLLLKRPSDPPAPPQTQSSPLDLTRLAFFFRAIMVYNILFLTGTEVFSDELFPELPEPVALYLSSYALSDDLWHLAYLSVLPITILGILSSVLCCFFLPFGRPLYLITVVWSLLCQLGPAPMPVGAYYGFFASIAYALNNMGLALMYFSPIRNRFSNYAD